MSAIRSTAIAVVLLCAVAIRARATTITVTNTNDSGPGSLRQALADAHDGDTVEATGISGVIRLTTGELLVDKSVTINGAGADVLAVDGHATSSVFQIGSGKTVTISDLTIRNGEGNFGGGILNGGGATLTITDSTLSGNIGGFGGGIFNTGTLAIVNCTVSGNAASEGAGIYNGATSTITNSTLSGNAAPGAGGGCVNLGTLQIANSTLSDNSSGLGGGVFNIGTLQIGNTILNTGDSGANISNSGGTVTSLGYNLSSDDGGGFLTGPGDQINTDPMLGPLQDNGGPTFTHALLPASPAIDTGDPNFTPPPFFDQRGPGFDRVVNGRIDIGSFEVQTQTVAIQLQASGRKVGGINTVRLTWSGATSTNIDVYRNGVLIVTTANDGSYTDSTGDTGRARYTYRVCEAGTLTCSNDARVRFRQ
ncbi:MAG: hypothetical protein DME87_05110 [Verrucomicrobia bacterium]|nr:MAG: hypothetical protein DME87_05110 [Verrucomicrobiota bacterium]